MPDQNRLPEPVIENHRRLLAFLTPRVADESTAETVLHAAYAMGYDEGNALRDDQKIVPWFYALLRGALEETAYRKEAIDRDLKKTLRECVDDLLGSLKEDQAQLIRKAELEEKSLKDLAHQARTSPTDIGARLHRARQSLKKKVLQAFGACHTHARIDCACQRPST